MHVLLEVVDERRRWMSVIVNYCGDKGRHSSLIVSLILGLSSRLTCSQDICSRSAVRASDTLTGYFARYKFVTSTWRAHCSNRPQLRVTWLSPCVIQCNYECEWLHWCAIKKLLTHSLDVSECWRVMPVSRVHLWWMVTALYSFLTSVCLSARETDERQCYKVITTELWERSCVNHRMMSGLCIVGSSLVAGECVLPWLVLSSPSMIRILLLLD